MRGLLVLVSCALLASNVHAARPPERPLVCHRIAGQSRAQAGHNPGALRPRAGQPWPGQIGIDAGPGGPFAIFADDASGWLALHLWLLDAYHVHGLTTVRRIIGRFAPPSENRTAAYIAGVAAALGVGPDAVLDIDQAGPRIALARIIARHEGWNR